MNKWPYWIFILLPSSINFHSTLYSHPDIKPVNTANPLELSIVIGSGLGCVNSSVETNLTIHLTPVDVCDSQAAEIFAVVADTPSIE